jgi:hypothetical protein
MTRRRKGLPEPNRLTLGFRFDFIFSIISRRKSLGDLDDSARKLSSQRVNVLRRSAANTVIL